MKLSRTINIKSNLNLVNFISNQVESQPDQTRSTHKIQMRLGLIFKKNLKRYYFKFFLKKY